MSYCRVGVSGDGELWKIYFKIFMTICADVVYLE